MMAIKRDACLIRTSDGVEHIVYGTTLLNLLDVIEEGRAWIKIGENAVIHVKQITSMEERS